MAGKEVRGEESAKGAPASSASADGHEHPAQRSCPVGSGCTAMPSSLAGPT
jgi:hypothetical protein